MDAAVTRPRFVGRAEELARLEDGLAAASGGTPRVVLIAGEAGVGKTRLLEEATSRWRARGILVLEGACLQPGAGGPPYAPVVGVLRSLRRAVEPGALTAVLGPGRGLLARLVPDLVDRAADLTADVADGTSQIRLFELIAGSIERLARRDPLVVAVEDIHWGDPSSRDLLDFLVRGLQHGERLLLVATLRTDAMATDDPARVWVAELMRLPTVQRIDLGPLARADVASLVADVLGRTPDPVFVDRVMDRANGNAFLAEELAAVGDGPDAPMPEHLREILLARLAPVAPGTRDVLRAAAAAGPRIDDDLLAEVMDLAPSAIHAALREGVGHGILVAAPSGELRFRHPLVRDAVADELFAGERQRLHVAFATALERRAEASGRQPRAEELALHWDAAGRPDRAAPAQLQAARAAASVYAWADASRRYERALELDREMPGSLPRDELPELLLEAANAAALAGDYDRAVALARPAVALVDAAAEPLRAASIHQNLRWFLWEAGDVAAAGAEVTEALRLTPATPPSALRARAVAHAGGLAMSAGDPAGALRLAEEAIATARQADAPAEEALGLGVAGWALAALGNVDAGAERFREAMAIARRLNGVEGLALGYTNLTAILDRAGRTEEAIGLAEAGFAEVERFGLARAFGVPLLAAAARLRFHQGHWDECARLLERARSLAPSPGSLASLELIEARLDAARGSPRAAEAALAAASAAERSAGRSRLAGLVLVGGSPMGSPGPGTDVVDPAGVPSPALQARIEVAAWRTDVDEASRLDEARRIEEAALSRPLGSPIPDAALASVAATATRIEADAAVAATYRRDEERKVEALERLDRLSTWLEAGLGMAADGGLEDVPTPALTEPRLALFAAQCRAERDRAEGRSDQARWAGVADGWERLGRALPAAYARYRQGEAALADPSTREAARVALRSAARASARLGAVPLRAEVERLARLARIDLADDGDSTRDGASAGTEGEPEPEAAARGGDGDTTKALGLTARELEVIRLLAEGWSNPEIADELGITTKTASVHVSNLLAKLGVPNRVEAAVAAVRLGLVAPAAAPGPGAEETDRADTIRGRTERSAGGPIRRTFLFTDIVGSTTLVEAIGDAAWRDLLRWHDATLRREFVRHGGHEVDHAGDGFFVVFRSSRDAVACAVAIQRTLAEHRASAGFAPTIRIGLHEGEAIEREGGYVGAAVHVASRIAARSEGGTILASTSTLREAGVRPEPPIENARLPGVAEPVSIARVAW